MTPEQHERISINYKSKITRLRNKAKAAPSLTEKIAIKTEVKKVEAELHAHRLDYYELVK